MLSKALNKLELSFYFYDVKGGSQISFEDPGVKVEYEFHQNIGRFQSTEPVKGEIIFSGSVELRKSSQIFDLTSPKFADIKDYLIGKIKVTFPNGKTFEDEDNYRVI